MLATLALASCSRVPVGETSARPLRPTIVSLNPCTDAILAQVARPGQLLAISHYSHDPASSSMDLDLARRFPETSGAVEEIVALAPDVVVAGTFLSPATRQALTDLGVRVIMMPMPRNVAASEAQVRQLAALVDNSQAGETLVGHIEKAMATAAAPTEAAPVPALVWESGGIVAGNDTLIADLLQRTGFINGAAARGLSQADFLPLERVIANPPRVIFAAGNPRSQEDRMLRHPALDGLSGTVYERLDSSLLWCGGPTIPHAVERLVQVRQGLARPRLERAGAAGGAP